MPEKRAFSRPMINVGLLCAVSTAIVIVELLVLLPTLPAEWWRPVGSPRDAGDVVVFDVRAMYVD